MPAGPPLPDGIADYIAAVRLAPPGERPPLETARLLADRHADRIAIPRPGGMAVATSFVVAPGRETPVRIYRPAGDGAQAALVYFHGGGFTGGSIESYEPLAMGLAEASGATVISVHYRRLPEATPRAIIEECFAVLGWARAMAEELRIDPARIGVAGDSAGAFIAAQLSILARDRGGPAIAAQVLLYGMFDVVAREAHRSAEDPVLSWPVIDAMLRIWHECDARDPIGHPAPLRRAGLSGLPPAILLGAAIDPMREEGEDYAARLRAAGVVVEARLAPSMPHGFLRALRFSSAARDEMARLGTSIRTILRT
nr:alpha/beta hydrolase [Sphingomonas sp. Y57]